MFFRLWCPRPKNQNSGIVAALGREQQPEFVERERVESRPRSVSPGGIVANGVENSVGGVNQD